MPLPTAVPPIGNSNNASNAMPARPSERSSCRAKPPNSWPSDKGVASIKWVRPIFRHALPRRRLLGQCPPALPQRRQQLVLDRQGNREMNRRGKHVVGALPHVDVIVGMDRLDGGEAIAPRQLNRPIGNHLVDVHVRRGAGAGLKDVDGELVVEAAVGDFSGGGDQGVNLGGGERASTRIPQFS